MTSQLPKIPKKSNSSLLLDSTEVVKVKTFNLSNDLEKAEYELILNNPALEIFRDEFMYDKSGNPRIVVWYYDKSK